MTDHDHIDALKAAAAPLRAAAALGLRSRGKRFFCPACQPDGDKTPDLSVGAKGFFCFKCGLKGDLLKLIEVAGNMDFPSAVAWLEKETGLPSPGRRKKGTHKGTRAGPESFNLGHPVRSPPPILSRSRGPRLILLFMTLS